MAEFVRAQIFGTTFEITSRYLSPAPPDPQMTGYVSTRYYRAPEIMLTWQKYDVEVDIWSAGCIFAEMLEGKPLFPGKDHVNQFSIITELLGTPPDDVIQTIGSENVRM
ncbi:hypothetical protein P7C71_g955, partial [Lecanoromycetidae sp. Uapishka_2]